MGFYIETDSPVCKAQQIIANHGGEIIPRPEKWEKGIVCVVSNGYFEAAGYAYDEREFEQFSHPDGRPRQWVRMDDELAQELSGYKQALKEREEFKNKYNV
jgi:hypothetical protein